MWANMLSANQIARFLNRLYLPNKLMKLPDLLYVDTNSWKLKVDVKVLAWQMGVASLVTGL